MDCVTDAQKALLRGLGYKFQDTTRWLAYNVSVVTIGPGQGNIHGGAPAGPGLAYFSDYSLNYTNVTQSIVPPQCIYSYDWLSANALAKWLAGYFDGAVEVAPAAGLFTTGLDEHASLTTASSALLLELYDGGRASLLRTSEIFTNITYSITTYIRQNGITHLSSPAVGLATHNETCVRIQWAWLTFPAGLVIMTLFFFVAMISGTRRTGHEVNNHDFKGSVLPLMFHGLYEDGPDSFGGTIGTLGQMSRDAKHVLVALSPTDRGWRFTEMNREKRHK